MRLTSLVTALLASFRTVAALLIRLRAVWWRRSALEADDELIATIAIAWRGLSSPLIVSYRANR